MKPVLSFVAALTLAFSGLGLVGCETVHSTPGNPYAGGDGVFGENPANPGQYAAWSASPTTQPVVDAQNTK